uniref:Uncharacterized protein n=1 Tax=Globodera rostochiensis TaxID=31243 RepID=A0A914I4G7_GLORO
MVEAQHGEGGHLQQVGGLADGRLTGGRTSATGRERRRLGRRTLGKPYLIVFVLSKSLCSAGGLICPLTLYTSTKHHCHGASSSSSTLQHSGWMI